MEKPNQFQVSWEWNGKYHVAQTPAKKIIKFSRQELINKGAQAIHMKVKDLGTGYSFFCTMVYAFNDWNERKALWSDLGAYSRSLKGPWVICGDFNTVLVPFERLGGNSTFEEMDDFQRCVAFCGVTDCSAIGSYYTWTNKQDSYSRVFSRLDRMLVNSSWLQDNGSVYAHFYTEGTFDYSPCVVQTHGDIEKLRRSFKYHNIWSKAAYFKACVVQAWSKD
ncbi:uncharacterized protein LOC141651588 [Silene latifolia]|uniref:uncharacterized protein LOC141651588 n=1 Tax=Silene latifolia TaxID=37657 RepID=UPI003D77804A